MQRLFAMHLSVFIVCVCVFLCTMAKEQKNHDRVDRMMRAIQTAMKKEMPARIEFL